MYANTSLTLEIVKHHTAGMQLTSSHIQVAFAVSNFLARLAVLYPLYSYYTFCTAQKQQTPPFAEEKLGDYEELQVVATSD